MYKLNFVHIQWTASYRPSASYGHSVCRSVMF